MAVKKSNEPKIKESKKTPYRKIEFSNEQELATDFATKVYQKFDRMIKAIVLFGSQARNTATSKSDVDIVCIIDDAAINWDLELISWYREELNKLLEAQEYGKDIHITTVKLTTWWNDLIFGDPVVINMLRYGEALVDVGGFFNPLKVLLLQGKIRSTHEAVYASLQRAPGHLARSKVAALSAIEGVYWCMVDSAQAALMTAGKLPPSPDHIAQYLKETFVDTKLLKIEAVHFAQQIHFLHKAINHGEITKVRGADIDAWQARGEAFMLQMSELIDQLLEASKMNQIEPEKQSPKIEPIVRKSDESNNIPLNSNPNADNSNTINQKQ